MAASKSNPSELSPRDLYMHLDMCKLVEECGGEYDKAASSVNDKIYRLPDGEKISIRKKTKSGFDIWCIPGTQGEKRSPVDLLIKLGIADTKRKAYDYLYELAGAPRTKYRYQRSAPIKSEEVKDQIVEVIDEKEIPFEPGQHLNFFQDRGIDLATLNHPLFVNRFGNSNGPFGYFEEPKNPRFKNDDLVYPNHILVPYTNVNDQVVALEAKSRLKDEVYQHKLDLAIRNNESISSIRQNVNQFYLGTSPANSLWRSNIPEKPNAIFVFEQPADAMAFFQIHRITQPELESSIFVSTGGNLKKGQIPIIKKLVDTHNIKDVELCFDNDIAGLNYALELDQALRGKGAIYFQLDSTDKFGIRCSILSGQQISKADLGIDKFVGQQNEVIKLLSAEFGEKVKEYFVPAAIAGDVYGYISMPYTPDHAHKIFNLNQSLAAHKDGTLAMTLRQPESSKDWNDKLRGLDNATQFNAVHLAAINPGPKRIFLSGTNRNSIIIEHKVISTDRSIQEAIGEVKFYEDNFGKPNTLERVHLSPFYTRVPEIDSLIEQLRKDINQVIPVMNEKWLNVMLNEHISYSPLTKEFYRKKDGVVGTIENGKLHIPSHISLNTYETLLITAKLHQVEKGMPGEQHGWHFINNRLYDGKYSNRNLRYDAAQKKVVKVEYLGKWSQATNSPVLNATAQVEMESFNVFVRQYADGNADIEGPYKIEFGFIKRITPVANWNGKQFDLSPQFQMTDETEEVLNRFRTYILSGRDPNKPGWMGTLDSNFVFQKAPGFDTERDLTQTEQFYFSAFNERLRIVQKNMQQFREKYPESRSAISSEGSELRLGNQALYLYDHQSSGANVTLTEQEFVTRNFHPHVYKALDLFIKNKGVFFNYPLHVFVNLESHDLFYKHPELPIGKIVYDEQQKPHMALYNNVPDALKAEISSFSEIPTADQDLLNRMGIKVDAELTTIKKKKVDVIPAKYMPFFEKSKFQFFSKDQIEKKSKSWQERYNEAYIWQKTYLPAQRAVLEEQTITEGLTEKNNKVYFRRLCIAEYDPSTDEMRVHVMPRPSFLQQLAIIEKQKVKNITKRKFSHHLLQAPAPQAAPTKREDVEKVLNHIDVSPDGMVRFLSKDFRVRNFGLQYGQSLLIERSISASSQVLHDAMQVYAKGAGLNLEFVDSLPEKDKNIIHTNIEIEENLVYQHALRLTREGILKTLATSEDFKKMVEITSDNRIVFNYLPGAGGALSVPFGEGGAASGIWMSNFPKEKMSMPGAGSIQPSLVLCEKPELALLYYQDQFSYSIHEPNFFLSFPGKSIERQAQLIESYLNKYKISKLMIAGSESYTDALFDIFRKDGSLTTDVVNNLETKDTLDQVRKSIAAMKPSDLLQHAMNRIDNGRLYNVADGVALIPVFNSAARETAIIGENIKRSFFKDANAPTIWMSQLPTTKQDRIVLAPTHKEAIFYMAMNGDEFNQRETIISLSDKPSDQAVNLVKSLIPLPRHRENMLVVNTKRLGAELINFQLSDVVPQNANPGFDTLEQQYADHIRQYQLADQSLQNKMEGVRHELGKSEAPALYPVQELYTTGVKLNF